MKTEFDYDDICPKCKKIAGKCRCGYLMPNPFLTGELDGDKRRDIDEYKIETDYNGLVFFDNTGENDLCKSHYLKYHRDKRMVESKKKFKKAKPCTKQWAKMCKEQGEIFNKWFKEQKAQKSTFDN